MLTNPQLNHIEGCIRNALQKINRARYADTQLRAVIRNPSSYSDAQLGLATKEGRHADLALTNALDELKDELTNLPLSTTPAATWPVESPNPGIPS